MDSTMLTTIVIGLFMVLAALIPLLARTSKRRSRITVKRIQEPSDPDLLPALELYSRAIPENERDSPENIVRWLQEVQTETREGRCELVDYFLAAKASDKPIALLYAHYYPASRLLHISYLVVDGDAPEAKRCAASKALVSHMTSEVKRSLKHCHGIVFELEYQDSGSKKKTRVANGRMRHFRALARMQNIVVKEIALDYRQPKLSLWEGNYREERQHLMYARARPPHLPNSIARSEVEKVVLFLYKQIYGDHFDDDAARDAEYHQYLDRLYLKAVAKLPDPVPLL